MQWVQNWFHGKSKYLFYPASNEQKYLFIFFSMYNTLIIKGRRWKIWVKIWTTKKNPVVFLIFSFQLEDFETSISRFLSFLTCNIHTQTYWSRVIEVLFGFKCNIIHLEPTNKPTSVMNHFKVRSSHGSRVMHTVQRMTAGRWFSRGLK